MSHSLKLNGAQTNMAVLGCHPELLLLVLLGLEVSGFTALAPVYVFLDGSEADLCHVIIKNTKRLVDMGAAVSTNTVLINRTNLYSAILDVHNNPNDWSAILDLTSSHTCVLFEVAATRGRPFLSLNDHRCRYKGLPAATTVAPSDQQYLNAVTNVVQRTNITLKPIHIAVFYDDLFDGTIIPGEDGWDLTVFYFLFKLTPSVNATKKLLLDLRKDVDVYTFIVLASKATIQVLLDQAAELKMLGTMGVYYRWFVVTKDEDTLFCSMCTGTDVIHLHHMIKDRNKLDVLNDDLSKVNTSFSLVKAVYAHDSLMAIYKYLNLVVTPNSTPVDDAFTKYLIYNPFSGIFGPIGVAQKTKHPDLQLTIDKLSKGFKQTVGSWSSRDGMVLNAELFPLDRGLPQLRVLTMPEVPFVIASRFNGEVNYTGYTIDVLNKVARANNFEYDLLLLDEIENRKPGVDPYDEMVQLLAEGTVDMIAATLSVTLKRTELVDFTIPYYDYAGIQILMKKPASNKNLFNFLTVFSWQVWVTIAGTLVVMTILVHILDRLSPFSYRNRKHLYLEGGKVYTIKESAWFVMGSFTKSGEGDSPKACSSRLLVAGFWFFCMVIMATFTANLAAFLTSSRLNSPVSSLDGLAQQSRMNYSVVRGHDAAEYFRHMSDIEDTFYDRWKEMSLGPDKYSTSSATSSGSKDKSYQYAVWDYPLGDKFTKIWQSIKRTGLLNSTSQGVEKVKADVDFAFLHMAPVLKYVAGQNCDLSVVGDQFSNKPFAFALQKNSPLTQQISERILTLQRDRELETIKVKWWDQSKVHCPKEDDVNTGITMETVGGVFIAMTMGIGLCLIALVVEVSCTKYHQPKTARVSMANGDKPVEMFGDKNLSLHRTNGQKFSPDMVD